MWSWYLYTVGHSLASTGPEVDLKYVSVWHNGPTMYIKNVAASSSSTRIYITT